MHKIHTTPVLCVLWMVSGCDGSTFAPGLVDVLSRVDARTVVRCATEGGAASRAACLGAAAASPILEVLLERARKAVERASMVGPGGAGADDASDADRRRAARDLDKALDELSRAVAETHQR